MRKLFAHLRHSRLAQVGVILVVLGGIAEALDQLEAVDLSAVPYVGLYAPTIVALAGLLKVIVRLLMGLITALGTAK